MVSIPCINTTVLALLFGDMPREDTDCFGDNCLHLHGRSPMGPISPNIRCTVVCFSYCRFPKPSWSDRLLMFDIIKKSRSILIHIRKTKTKKLQGHTITKTVEAKFYKNLELYNLYWKFLLYIPCWSWLKAKAHVRLYIYSREEEQEKMVANSRRTSDTHKWRT